MGLSDLCLGIHKITIKCPKALRTFDYVVMLFGLKNAKATYQHSMNVLFHDLIGKIMKVYIDDIVVQGSIGSFQPKIIQAKKQQPVYYFSRLITKVGKNYSPI